MVNFYLWSLPAGKPSAFKAIWWKKLPILHKALSNLGKLPVPERRYTWTDPVVDQYSSSKFMFKDFICKLMCWKQNNSWFYFKWLYREDICKSSTFIFCLKWWFIYTADELNRLRVLSKALEINYGNPFCKKAQSFQLGKR